MITKLPPVGFKILQISLQIMHHFLSRLCWPLLKVQFAGHAHVKLVLDVGMWVTDWECGHRLGMWVTGYELSTRSAVLQGRTRWRFRKARSVCGGGRTLSVSASTSPNSTASAARAETVSDSLGTRLTVYQVA